jgi:gliding motility-associated-like protein
MQHKFSFILSAVLLLVSTLSFGQCGITLDTLIAPLCNGDTTGSIELTGAGAAGPCSSPTVVINEIFINPADANDGRTPNPSEAIELIGPAGTNIGCYVLTDGDWMVNIPTGTTIPADGIFTIGFDAAYTPGTFDLDLGACNCGGGSMLGVFTNGGEYLAMFDATGTIYGNQSAANTPVTGLVIANVAGVTSCTGSVTLPSVASFTTVAGPFANGGGAARNPDGAGGTWTSTTNMTINACNAAGVPVLNYVWSNGLTTEDVTGLASGTYTVTLTDATGCSATASYSITEPSAILPVVDSTGGVSCGTNDGFVATSASGGTGAYSYNWSNGATTDDIFNLGNGPYDLTITDVNGCQATISATVSGSGTPVVTLDSTVIDSCLSNKGALFITASSGTGSYTYQWSNGTTAQNATGLAAGIYTLTIDDGNCTDSVSFTVGSTSSFTVLVDSFSQVNCNGDSTGAVFISVSDTSSALCSSASVRINEVMHRPGPGIDGQDPNTGEYLELIGPAGTNIGGYVLTDGDWTLTIPTGTIIPADGIFSIGNDIVYGAGTFDLDAESCACFTEGTGGSALLILTTGGEYVAIFDNTGVFVDGMIYGTPSAGNTPPNGAFATGGVISTVGLAGTPASVTIPGPAAFSSVSGSLPSVAGGISWARTPDGSGSWGQQTGGSLNNCNSVGTGVGTGYTYLWNTGDTTAQITGLAAGVYTATITDTTNGCAQLFIHTVTAPAVLVVQIDSLVQPICTPLNSGALFTSTTGGTGTYNYNWSSGATTANLQNIVADFYSLTVTDSLGCVATDTARLTTPSTFAINATLSDIACFGDSTGAISLSLAPVDTIYSFAWSTTQTNQNITGLGAGAYTVTVVDTNACVLVDTFTLTQPNALALQSSTMDSVRCNGEATGALTVAITGGTPGYAYQWFGSTSTSDTASNLSAGIYIVTVTDTLGCQFTQSLAVEEPTVLASTYNVKDISCDSTSDGQVAVSVTGGTPNYSFAWANQTTTDSVLTGLNSGQYTVTVTDAMGCTISNVNIGVRALEALPAGLLSITALKDTLDCDLAATANLQAKIDSTGVFTYLWSNTSSNATATGLAAGIYTVTVSNINGCTAVLSDTIVAPIVPALAAYIDVAGTTVSAGDLGQLIEVGSGTTQNDINFNWSYTAAPGHVLDITNNQSGTTDVATTTGGTFDIKLVATGTDSKDCTDSATVQLNVTTVLLGMPNAFTPTDIVNNYFFPVGLSADDIIEFNIFNRWGQQVFEGANTVTGWDGTYKGLDQPVDTYLYLLKYQTAADSAPQVLKGQVHLIR